MKKEEAQAAIDILQFIQNHPDAKHTAEGIARYWILQQRLEEHLEVVLKALEFLQQKGFIETRAKANGGVFYKSQKDKIIDIPEFLKTMKDG